jgi:hypothetical protein
MRKMRDGAGVDLARTMVMIMFMVRDRSSIDMALPIVTSPDGRPRRQGYEAGGSIGPDRLSGQGRVVIYDIENLRLELTDLAIDRRHMSGRRGVDAAHQGGFLPQQADHVLDVMEGAPGEPLIRDRILKTGLGGIEIVDDGGLVADIDPADELGHGIVEDQPGDVHRVDECGNSAVGHWRECISTCQHISAHVRAVRHQDRRSAIDQIRVAGFKAGNQFTRGRSLHPVEGELVVETGREQAALRG